MPRAILLAFGFLMSSLAFQAGNCRADPIPAATEPSKAAATTRSSAIYYVDFAVGDDQANGRSPQTAWKHLPGTRQGSTWKSAYITTSFAGGAVVANKKRLRPGTVIRLKGGTEQDSRHGGSIVIGPDFYDNGTSDQPIILERDPQWGQGPVVFNGKDLPLQRWEVQFLVNHLDHVRIKGNGAGGIVFTSSPKGAVGVYGTKEKRVVGLRVSDVSVTGFSDAGFGAGWLDDYELTAVELDGKSIAGNSGFHFGEWPCDNGVFRRCVAHDLGDQPGAQSGGTDIQIGFFLVNSRNVTYQDCTSFENEGDGYDVGLYHATEETATDNIRYINCLSHHNADGFGMNAGEALQHCMRITCINSIAYDNAFGGFHAYGGTAEYCYVHCLAHHNADANYNLGPDGWLDKTTTTVRIYNSIGYKPDPKFFHKANILTCYARGSRFRLDSDYNFWAYGDLTKDRNFCYWDALAGKAPFAKAYSYQDGPGNMQGDWYKLDEDGHLNCDGHSLNAALGHVAGFTDEATHNYHLTATSSLRGKGINLRGKPWFLPEMALDREGRLRTRWDIGPYEAR